jgi:hypothetical protein
LDFNKLGLQLLSLTQDGPEARNLLVGHFKSVACAIDLVLCCDFSCGIELRGRHRIRMLACVFCKLQIFVRQVDCIAMRSILAHLQ